MYMYNTDMTPERKQLQATRNDVLRHLRQLGPWVEGTLVETTRQCGKKNCLCHHGGPKHPVLFLTRKESGKTVSLYIPRALETEVRVWAQNYKKLKELIRRASQAQEQLIRLRD